MILLMNPSSPSRTGFLWFLIFYAIFFFACSQDNPSSSATDTLILKNGGKIQCKVMSEDETKITVQYQGGLVDFTRAEIQTVLRDQKLVKTKDGIETATEGMKLSEYPRVVTKAGKTHFGKALTKEGDQFKLAKEGQDEGKIETFELSQIEKIELWPPTQEKDLDKSFKELRQKNAKFVSNHPPYYIVSSVDPSDFAVYTRILDQFFNDFLIQLFELIDVKETPIKALAVVIFGDYRDFMQALGFNRPGILGVYIPTTRVLNLFNVREAGFYGFFTGRSEKVVNRLGELKGKIAETATMDSEGKWKAYDEVEKYQFDLEKKRGNEEFYAREMTIQTLRHEGTHQLCHALGLVDHMKGFRGAWLSEGFAEFMAPEEFGGLLKSRMVEMRNEFEAGHKLAPLDFLLNFRAGGHIHTLKDPSFSSFIYAPSCTESLLGALSKYMAMRSAERLPSPGNSAMASISWLRVSW